ncbi:hypothetical protein QKW55_19285 [Bacillus paralicheniformis]|nr:hypothetical protein QKW55_19285 [Bacillus paralicheniformis]
MLSPEAAYHQYGAAVKENDAGSFIIDLEETAEIRKRKQANLGNIGISGLLEKNTNGAGQRKPAAHWPGFCDSFRLIKDHMLNI